MDLARYHLVRAHERVKDAADCLQATLISQHNRREAAADGFFEDALAQLQDAAKELGFRMVPSCHEPLTATDEETLKSYLAGWTPPT